MKTYWSLGHRLPYFVSKYLFGDRRNFGLEVKIDDPDWMAWQNFCVDSFYQTNQKEVVGKVVNDVGYSILSRFTWHRQNILKMKAT